MTFWTFAVRSIPVCAFAILTSGLWAQMPRSVSYSFEYAVTGMGGGVSSSADYSLVSVSDANGMASPSESVSDMYRIEPAVGVETVEDVLPSSVDCWSLYQ